MVWELNKPLFFGGSQLRWFLGTWGFFDERRQQWPICTGIPPKHVGEGELGFLRTRAFVVCLLWLSSGASGPPLAIHGRLGSCTTKTSDQWRVAKRRSPRKTFFQKTPVVYHNGESYPKGSEEKRECYPKWHSFRWLSNIDMPLEKDRPQRVTPWAIAGGWPTNQGKRH